MHAWLARRLDVQATMPPPVPVVPPTPAELPSPARDIDSATDMYAGRGETSSKSASSVGEDVPLVSAPAISAAARARLSM